LILSKFDFDIDFWKNEKLNDAKDLIRKCTHPLEPSQRINIEGVVSHPWYKKN